MTSKPEKTTRKRICVALTSGVAIEEPQGPKPETKSALESTLAVLPKVAPSRRLTSTKTVSLTPGIELFGMIVDHRFTQAALNPVELIPPGKTYVLFGAGNAVSTA